MGRLNASNVPVFLLHGNHDAESQITRRLDLPDNVYVFGTRKPETFALEHLNVALHGQSFRQRDVTENLVPDYPAPVSGAFNIGVLHTGLGGMGGHANYAPCSFDDLANKGYDGIVKLTECRLLSAFLHGAKPLKLHKAAIDNLPRFRSESG